MQKLLDFTSTSESVGNGYTNFQLNWVNVARVIKGEG